MIETVYIDDNAASHFRPVRDSLRIYGMIVLFAASSLISWLVDFGLFSLLRYVILPAILPQTVSPFGTAFEIPILFASAYALARIVSATLNYTLNRRVVFGDGDKSSVPRYFILSVCQLAISAGLGQFIVWALPADHPSWLELIIKMAVDTTLFFLSFRIQNNWVFRPRDIKSRS
jgi:putative flippase GtrA